MHRDWVYGKEYILYTQEFGGMSCVFFLGEKLSLQISSIILSENMSTAVISPMSIASKSWAFWSTTDGDANNVGPPLPGPALRTSAGSSTNLHMLSTILGADLQENFLREFTYFTKGISQHSQLKKRTLTWTRPSNMSPLVRSKAEASDPCWSAWLIWRFQRSPDVASVLRTSELQCHQVTASLGTASITSTFAEMCGHMHCDALCPRSAEAQHGGWKA